MSNVARFDGWLTDDQPEAPPPAALVLRQPLTPVEGPDGVLFPATYAAAEDKSKFAGGYNIDTFPDGTNVCLVDSVGSQANRIEPLFMKGAFAALVPQLIVQAGDKQLHLLEAGHRSGDASIRCSGFQPEFHAAFRAAQNGNAGPLAKLAPTSLVFGVWDSRETQVKLPRLVSATIRAFNVRELTRSANFLPQMRHDYIIEGQLPEPVSKAEKDEYSKRGYLNALASATHGGVIADGGVRRDVTLSLAALRLLAYLPSDGTTALRRYILGLSLVAVTASPATYLRQGCNLVPDPDKPAEFTLVHSDGKREPFVLSAADALSYAQATESEFKKGADRTVPFEQARALRDVGQEPAGEPTTVTTGGRSGRRGRGRTAEGE